MSMDLFSMGGIRTSRINRALAPDDYRLFQFACRMPCKGCNEFCMYDILQSSKSASSTQHTRGKYRQTGLSSNFFPGPVA